LDIEPYLSIVAVFATLIISAGISAAEAAFMSLSHEDARGWQSERRPSCRRMFALMREPEKLLATMQVGGALANVAAVLLAANLLFMAGAAAGVAAVAILLLLLVFCVLAPRMYASRNAASVLPRFALMLSVLQKSLYPLTLALAWSKTAVRKRAQKKQCISINDLSDALEQTSDVPENESILKGIVKFGNIDVHTIMTPRTDVEAVDISIGLAELMRNINEWGYSRIPVYDDSPDNVKGILYVKDLLPYIEEANDFQWQKLIRDAYFVPENKKIDDLLKEFQEKKMHLSVIIDEYGGMAGIVTLEDILEEIVGEIADESDDDEKWFNKVDDHTYVFDGKALLNDFFRITRIDEADFAPVRGEADTLAGVILEMKGEIPKAGDIVEHKNLTFSIEAVDNRRIKQIKVEIHE